MKLKPYHSILIFAILMTAAMFSSVSNYRKAQYAIIKDMDQALSQTIQERQDQWITPDTIQSYRSHLSIGWLKETSILCYAVEDKRNRQRERSLFDKGASESNQLANMTSKQMLLNKHSIQGYANCSMADIFGTSNQRTPLSLSFLAMLWGCFALYYHKRKTVNVSGELTLSLALADRNASIDIDRTKSHESQQEAFGSLSYSSEEDTFYNLETKEDIRFTPMQHQLMQMFLRNAHHQLSKQEICEALWPKKPDASETLYTLIRRIKPIIESSTNLMIESARGKAYRLVEK